MTENKTTLAQKLLSVQKSIGNAVKSASNPHFRSKYADLNEVLDVSKEALNVEGVFIAQAGGSDAGGHYLETSLIDADTGQQMSGKVYLVGIPDMQKMGAGITYARRFGLKSLLAMGDTDDDGETLAGRGHMAPTSAAKPTAAPVKPAAAEAPKAPVDREKVNKKITETSKVLIDSKRMTQEEVVAVLESFKVKSKEELNNDQAEKLLGILTTRLQ